MTVPPNKAEIKRRNPSFFNVVSNSHTPSIKKFLKENEVNINDVIGINSYIHYILYNYTYKSRENLQLLIDCGAIVTPDIIPPLTWKYFFHIEILFKNNLIDAHYRNAEGVTFLHQATANQIEVFVQKLIGLGADVNAKSKIGETVLQMAFQTNDEKIIQCLLDCDIDVHAQDQNRDTPLHYAVNLENIKFAKFIIAKGANVNAFNKYRKTPLHLAILKDNIELVKLLFSSGADINCRTLEKKTPLHLAVARKSIEMTKLLLELGAGVNDYTEAEITPLHIAVDTGFFNMVTLLIDNQADVNAIGLREETPLNIAVAYEHQNIAAHLIASGAIVNHGLKKDTLLHMAVFNKNEYLVQLLLEHNADVSVKYRDGMTPLHMAVNCKCPKIAEMLLEKNADVNDCTEKGDTPLHIAIENKDYESVEILLKYKPNINIKNKLGKTVLYIAAEKGAANVVNKFLECEPDLNENKLALHFAVKGKERLYMKIVLELVYYGFSLDFVKTYNEEQIFDFIEKSISNGHSGIVENLLRNGFDPNTPSPFKNDTSSKTLLHFAVDNDQFQNTKILIKYGSDVNAIDEKGHSPIYYSIQRNNLEIMKLLLDNKAVIDKNDYNLFFMAIAKGNSGLIKEFLNYYDNINITDEFGRTALHQAVWNGDEETIQLLFEKGIKCKVIESPPSGLNTELEKIIREYFGEDMLEDFRKNLVTTPLHIAARKNNSDIVEALIEYGYNVNCKDLCGRTPLHLASLFKNAGVIDVLVEYGANLRAKDNAGYTPINYVCDSEQFISNYLLDKVYICFYNMITVIDEGTSTSTAIELLIKYLVLNSKNVSDENFLNSCAKLHNFYEKCHKEVEILKNKSITKTIFDNITFYDVLTKNINTLASYLKNKDFIESYESVIKNNEFKIYKNILNKRMKKAKERRIILDETEIYCLNIFCLPVDHTYKIMSYLNNRDLNNVKEAYELSFNELGYCKCKES